MTAQPPGASAPSLLSARPHPFWTTLAILLLFVFSGVAVQILPVVAPAVLLQWKLDGTALAAPVSAILVGSALGTVLGGVISDLVGRRPLIIASVAVLTLFMGLSSLATQPWHFTATMLVAGLAMGCYFSPGMALVAELTPPHRRPLAISLTVASLPVGLTLCSFTASRILPTLGWEQLFVLAAALGIPCFLLFAWFVPESPGFMATRPERAAEYRRVLARLSLPAIEVPDSDQPKQPLGRRFALLFAAAPVATACLLILFLATNAFGNGALSWIPSAISQLGFPLAFSSGAIASWTMVTMLATPIAGWMLGRYGLKLVCGGSIVISGVALGLMGMLASLEAGEALISALLAMAGLGTAGFVTSLYTLAAESFPAELRASGIGISDAIGRVGGVLGAYFGAHLLAMGGANGFFYLLAALMAVSLVVLAILLKATAQSRS